MKFKLIMLLFTAVTSINCLVSKRNARPQSSITLYVLNTKATFGTYVSPNEFWDVIQEYPADIIQITGIHLNELVKSKIQSLRDTAFTPVHTQIALISSFENTQDTFYTDPRLRCWQSRGKSFIDDSGFFKLVFSRFLIYWYPT